MDAINLDERSWIVESADQNDPVDPGRDPEPDETVYDKTGKSVKRIVLIVAAVVFAAAVAMVFLIRSRRNNGSGALVADKSMLQSEEISDADMQSSQSKEEGVYVEFRYDDNDEPRLWCVIDKNSGQSVQDIELCIRRGDERSDAQYTYNDGGEDYTEIGTVNLVFSFGAGAIDVEYDVQYSYELSATIDGVEYCDTGAFVLERLDESPD